MIEYRTIKSIIAKGYEIELFQDQDGRYRIRYQTPWITKYSEWITDFGTASYMFDLKWEELEGSVK